MFKTEYDVNVTLVPQLVTWTHVIHHEIDKKQILYIKSTNRLRTPKPLGYQIRITRKIRFSSLELPLFTKCPRTHPLHQVSQARSKRKVEFGE